jgi:bifunctional DNase/RNase
MKEVRISNMVEGIFHAVLVLEQNGREIEIDSRSSDAIALAMRFSCPIFTYEFILSAAGINVEDSEEEEEGEAAEVPARERPIGSSSLEELKEMLEEALEQEDYERASQLRDEIKRREQAN